jgi:hypothetical protein
VGIGTSTPRQTLTLNGGFYASTTEGVRVGFGNSAVTDIAPTYTSTDILLRSGSTTPYIVMQVGTTTANGHFVVADILGNNLFNVRGDGNVGIGTVTPGYKLDVNGAMQATGAMYSSGGGAGFVANDRSTSGTGVFYRTGSINYLYDNSAGNVISYGTSGTVGIGTTPQTEKLYVNGNTFSYGNITAQTAIYDLGTATGGSTTLCRDGGTGQHTICSSDARLKHNISTLSDGALDKISHLRPVTYVWNSDASSTLHAGFIAQDTMSYIPEAVGTGTPDGFYSWDSNAVLSYSVKALQELNQKVTSIASSSAATTSLYISVSGNLGVGSTNPTSKLEIKDETSSSDVDVFRIITNVDSSSNVKFRIDSDVDLFTDGSVTIGTPADIAEAYTSLDNNILPGMLVSFVTSSSTWSPTGTGGTTYTLAGIVKATSSSSVIGVVSTNPGITLGKDIPNATPVAFMGRIPVLVTNEHGSIEVGDLLTLSTSTPGVATKLTGNGTSIGRALSPYTSTSTTLATSTILLYVDIRDTTLTITSLPGLTLATSTATTTATTSILATITSAITDGISVVTDFFAVKITALYAYVDTLFAREVRAEEKVCIGSTCINENDLKDFIQYKNGINNSSTNTTSSFGTTTTIGGENNSSSTESVTQTNQGTSPTTLDQASSTEGTTTATAP